MRRSDLHINTDRWESTRVYVGIIDLEKVHDKVNREASFVASVENV